MRYLNNNREENAGFGRNSSPAIVGSPFGSANRRICGSLTLAQISPYGETSHIPGTLFEIASPPTSLSKFKI